MGTLVWTGTRAELLAALRNLPAALAGNAPDPLGLARPVQLRVGVAALTAIHDAFIVKSGGGTGSDGITWPPLKAAPAARSTGALVKSGDLLRSLEPGYGDEPSGAADQVFRLEPGAVTVGTSERKADWHQFGTKTIPPRAIVPPDGELPAAWEPAIEDAALAGVVEAVEMRVA